MPIENQQSIRLPYGGQSSPVRADDASVRGLETPLQTVRRRVCSAAFRALENLKASDGSTTMGQIRLAHAPLTSLESLILAMPSSDTQFSTIRLGVTDDGEVVLEWFFDEGRIQFFIDAELEDSTAVFLDGRTGGPMPSIESMLISASDIDSVVQQAVDLAMELA